MGLFNDFQSAWEDMDLPQEDDLKFDVNDSVYIHGCIKLLKKQLIRNRFKLESNHLTMTEFDIMTNEPKNVTEVYLLGELCLNKRPQFYTKPIKCENYVLFEDEALVCGGRNYIRGKSVEIEILYKIGNAYHKGWFKLECYK